jgi:hypothetical protein
MLVIDTNFEFERCNGVITSTVHNVNTDLVQVTAT